MLLDIIVNSYGNFIIQKLLHLVNQTQRLILLKKISEIIPDLPKKNIRAKWAAIVEEHKRNIEYSDKKEYKTSFKTHLTQSQAIKMKVSSIKQHSHDPKNSDNVKFVNNSSNCLVTSTLDMSKPLGANHGFYYNKDNIVSPRVIYFKPINQVNVQLNNFTSQQQFSVPHYSNISPMIFYPQFPYYSTQCIYPQATNNLMILRNSIGKKK